MTKPYLIQCLPRVVIGHTAYPFTLVKVYHLTITTVADNTGARIEHLADSAVLNNVPFYLIGASYKDLL